MSSDLQAIISSFSGNKLKIALDAYFIDFFSGKDPSFINETLSLLSGNELKICIGSCRRIQRGKEKIFGNSEEIKSILEFHYLRTLSKEDAFVYKAENKLNDLIPDNKKIHRDDIGHIIDKMKELNILTWDEHFLDNFKHAFNVVRNEELENNNEDIFDLIQTKYVIPAVEDVWSKLNF